PGAELPGQVVADFRFDGPARDASALHILAQRAKCRRLRGHLSILAPAFARPGGRRGLGAWQAPAMIPHVAIVYAHRGGSKLRPENTLIAFDHGLALGADGLEFDVHLSRDGVVVVHHDATLDRTTNGSGPLAALTADELGRLDAGYHFDGFRGRGG